MNRTLLAGVVTLVLAGPCAAPIPTASAEPCPDVEVIFARGTSEPAGVGFIGQQFVDALRGAAPAKSMTVYAVNYAASGDFTNPMEFAQTVIDGVRDASRHVESTAANCPNTRIVLGGFSQGAVVAGFATSSAAPEGVPADLLPAPLPPEVADLVAAVTLFGMPSAAWMRNFGAPPVVIGPSYADKTIQLCNPGDAICDGDPTGMPNVQHIMYGANGMVGQAAAFAAARI